MANLPYHAGKIRFNQKETVCCSGTLFGCTWEDPEMEMWRKYEEQLGPDHSAIKQLQRQQKGLSRMRMAEQLLQENDNISRYIWCELKKMKANKKISPSAVDGCNDDIDIAHHFGNKYKELFNCSPSSELKLMI